MRRYNVVEVKQKDFLGGRFTAVEFLDLLDEHSREGWIFDRVVGVAEVPWMDRDTFMIVLYLDE